MLSNGDVGGLAQIHESMNLAGYTIKSQVMMYAVHSQE